LSHTTILIPFYYFKREDPHLKHVVVGGGSSILIRIKNMNSKKRIKIVSNIFN